MPLRKTKKPLDTPVTPFGVFVLESHHDVGFKMGKVKHAFLKILYILSGQGKVVIASKPIDCQAGDVIVVPVGHDNYIQDHPQAPMALYGVCIMPGLYQDALLEEAQTDWLMGGNMLPRDAVQSQKMRQTLRKLLYEQTAAGQTSPLRMVSYALQLLAQVLQWQEPVGPKSQAKPTTTRNTQLHQKVKTYSHQLSTHFFEPGTLDSVAMGLGMSRRRFTQLFRQLNGVSWLEAITRYRLAHAKHLLRDTAHTVISIAFECGYEDLSSFYRAFKRCEKISPNAWRQKHPKQSKSTKH